MAMAMDMKLTIQRDRNVVFWILSQRHAGRIRYLFYLHALRRTNPSGDLQRCVCSRSGVRKYSFMMILLCLGLFVTRISP